MDQDEQVTLVNDDDEPAGLMPKLEAHLHGGKLHRAVSVFVRNSSGELLLQQRAITKYHCGGLWTNTCCTHPRPNEGSQDAAHRRLREEMGIACPLVERFTLRYSADCGNGLTENEIDHVFKGEYDGAVTPNPEEVDKFRWVPLDILTEDVRQRPASFAPWFRIILPRFISDVFPAAASWVIGVPSQHSTV
jgi:isopentenyl-diphosphate delta-isomerase